MSPNSRRPSVRRPFLFCFLLSGMLLAGTAALTTSAPRAAAAFAAPGSSTASRAFIAAAVPVVAGSPVPHAPKTDQATQARLQESYGKLPLSFEANQGQMDSEVKFLSRGNGYSLFLTSTEAVLALRKQEGAGRKNAVDVTNSSLAPGPSSISTLRMKLLGASPTARITGLDELPGKANYFIGTDPGKWRTNVPTYAKIKREAVYPGVDLVYYGNQQQLEYDFVVAPGADTRVIALAFEGARKMRLDARGDLVLRSAGQDVRWRRPIIYQEIDGVRREIAGGYQVKASRQVGFRVAAYDRSRPLIIDPVLVYSTYLGGSNFDAGRGIAVDGAGSAYVTGSTSSTNFPTLGAAQTTNAGNSDAFVTKLDATGSALVYSTYLGGSNSTFGAINFDVGFGIAVDGAGSAYVTGSTNSTNFPTTPGAAQTTYAGSFDAFVTKLDATGSALVYSTYLGGSSNAEESLGIAVDGAGSAYVTGSTSSTNFPTTLGAAQTTNAGSPDVFVTKLDATGSSRLYSTYLGGSGSDFGRGIAVDGAGSAYVTGFTDSTNFPTTPGAAQTTNAGIGDAFVTKLDVTGSARLYSTYLGGSNFDEDRGIAVDGAGSAYVTGYTFSTNFPTTPGAAQTTNASTDGSHEAFVTKLDATGSALVYSTYLGGSSDDRGLGIAVDEAGSAYVIGLTGSANFPTLGAAQPTYAGVWDAFVTQLDASGSALVYSTYLGGSGEDVGLGIAVDGAGSAYVTGYTRSANFPTTLGAAQPTHAGSSDAFVAKIAGNSDNCPNVANPDQKDLDGDGQGDACDPDDDNDTVPDTADNCQFGANTDQANNDGDALGDVCDPDDDNDGIADTADNCPLVSNPSQTDTDGDGQGDACDPDDDNDGVADGADNCPLAANPNQANNDGDAQGDVCDPDDDNDGVPDGGDNCPNVANPDQANNDGDAQGDVCDTDDDNDTVPDTADNCQFAANTDQANNDGDALGDVCDSDDDNDGIADTADNCPLVSNSSQTDTDGDGQGDACDPDDDNDGVADGADNCPLAANPNQANNDGDAQGDVCDPDDDNDGVPDEADNCPNVSNPDQRDTDGDGVGDVCTPFQFPQGGQFVIGDLVNIAGGATVNFWGSQWANNNPMSGGPGPNDFEGFENGNSTPACGGTWTSQPGNSSNPPATIPQFMAVIVSSSVQQNGSVITGGIRRIIVVKTDPGYAPSPGHRGTGQVVAVLCIVP